MVTWTDFLSLLMFAASVTSATAQTVTDGDTIKLDGVSSMPRTENM